MMMHDNSKFSEEEKCNQCNGCIKCTDESCIYHSGGNMEHCAIEKCTYCNQFIKKHKLFLNNVG